MKTVIEFIKNLDDGGAQVVIRNYAEAIDRNKLSLIVLTLFPSKLSATQTAITQLGIPINSLYPSYNVFFRAINKFFGKHFTAFLLKRKIEQLKPCVIHVHMDLLKFLAPIRFALNNIKLFYTCHTLPEYYFTGNNEIEKEAAKVLIRDNKLQIIALYEEMAIVLNSLLSIDNTVVIKNGINIAKFRNVEESKQEIRKSLNIPINTYVVGHVGRFEQVKNHFFLIEIFTQLLQRRDAHLVMVGDDGTLLPEIKEKIRRLELEKKVTILSHRNDIDRLLKAFDVFVFPSLFEGMSLALLEAQAAGLRCVISDKISDEARVIDSTVSVSLDKTSENWCNIILDEHITQSRAATLEEYDIYKIIKKLQCMYIG